jgi:hypothetical protein
LNRWSKAPPPLLKVNLPTIEDKLGKESPAQASKILQTDSGNYISPSKGVETPPSQKDISTMQPNTQEDVNPTLARAANILRESLSVDDGGAVFLDMSNPRISNSFSILTVVRQSGKPALESAPRKICLVHPFLGRSQAVKSIVIFFNDYPNNHHTIQFKYILFSIAV